MSSAAFQANCPLRRAPRRRRLCSSTDAPVSRVPDVRALDAPLAITAPVVPGFGRGSRRLGFPTANLSTATPAVAQALTQLAPGVYCGYAALVEAATGTIAPPWHPAVMNVGAVPTFDNPQQSFEVHLVHAFEHDFYGRLLRVVVLGFLRRELKFASLDALIANIRNDVQVAQQALPSMRVELDAHAHANEAETR